MRFLNSQSLNVTGVTTTQNGTPIDSSFMVAISAQAVVSGTTPMGTYKLQFSNDMPVDYGGPATFTPTNWSDISGSSVVFAAAGPFALPKIDVSYQWIRSVMVYTSGTVNISDHLKSVGF